MKKYFSSKKRIIAITSVTILLFAAFFFFFDNDPDQDYHHAQVLIGNTTFNALVSDTEALRTLGLSGRSGLKDGQVMLFVFDQPGILGFWMKDMRFSIDMLWLSADHQIISFKENVSPDTYPQVFAPPAPARYVIELPAGTLAKLGVKAGDRVSLSAQR